MLPEEKSNTDTAVYVGKTATNKPILSSSTQMCSFCWLSSHKKVRCGARKLDAEIYPKDHEKVSVQTKGSYLAKNAFDFGGGSVDSDISRCVFQMGGCFTKLITCFI